MEIDMKKTVIAAILFLSCLIMPLAHAVRLPVRLPIIKNVVILKTNEKNAAAKTRQALIKGVMDKEWRIVSDSGNTMRLRLDVRARHTIIIDVHIRDNTVDVDYVSSEGMDYQRDYKGGICALDGALHATSSKCAPGDFIHPKYGLWVKNLLDSASYAANRLDEGKLESGVPSGN